MSNNTISVWSCWSVSDKSKHLQQLHSSSSSSVSSALFSHFSWLSIPLSFSLIPFTSVCFDYEEVAVLRRQLHNPVWASMSVYYVCCKIGQMMEDTKEKKREICVLSSLTNFYLHFYCVYLCFLFFFPALFISSFPHPLHPSLQPSFPSTQSYWAVKCEKL